MKKILILLSLSIALYVSSRALFYPQFFRVHDYVHVARLVEMQRALQDGHFPVRWSKNFGYGYGMPLFSFYAPLPSYLGIIFIWLGFTHITAVRLLFFLVSLTTLIGSYFLCKTLWSSRIAGVIGAVMITLAPYRAVNLYVRGALSEAWGIAFIPLILLGIVNIAKQKKNGVFLLSVSLAGMLLSHNLVSIMFLPLSISFAVVFSGTTFFLKNKSRKSYFKLLWKFMQAYLLGIGVSAFYIFPAFLEKNFTKVESAVTGGYFDYRLHFLYIRQFFSTDWGYGGSEWGPTDSISFSLGVPQLIFLLLTIAGVVAFVAKLFQNQKPSFLSYSHLKAVIFHSQRKKNIMLIYLASILISMSLLILSLFMSLTKSQWVWESLPVLSFIQFPWRWLSIAIVFLGISISAVVVFVPKVTRIMLVCLAVILCSVTAWSQFMPESFLENADDFYYTDEKRIQNQMSDILFDYQPKQMDQPLAPPEQLLSEVEGASFTSVTKVDRVHQKAIALEVKTPGYADISIAAFPGWQAYLNGEKIDWIKSQRGTMMIPVTMETKLISLNYEGTFVQKLSNLISLFALAVTLVPIIVEYGINKEYLHAEQ